VVERSDTTGHDRRPPRIPAGMPDADSKKGNLYRRIIPAPGGTQRNMGTAHATPPQTPARGARRCWRRLRKYRSFPSETTLRLSKAEDEGRGPGAEFRGDLRGRLPVASQQGRKMQNRNQPVQTATAPPDRPAGQSRQGRQTSARHFSGGKEWKTVINRSKRLQPRRTDQPVSPVRDGRLQPATSVAGKR